MRVARWSAACIQKMSRIRMRSCLSRHLLQGQPHCPLSVAGLAMMSRKSYSPPTAAPREAKPFAKALYLSGRTSTGIVWTINIVLSVTPIRIPPPMSIGIEVAFAEATAPMKATKGRGGCQILPVKYVAECSDNGVKELFASTADPLEE